jgi:hypothetical protein
MKAAIGTVLNGSAWEAASKSWGRGKPAKMVEALSELPEGASASSSNIQISNKQG